MNAKTDELIQEFVVHGGDPQEWWKEWHGSYSIAPTDSAPIVRDRSDGRFLELVRWDWEKPNMRPGAPLINARVEKLATGFWAPAFTAARCVVPMRGYFEWTGEKGAKFPHYLHGDGRIGRRVGRLRSSGGCRGLCRFGRLRRGRIRRGGGVTAGLRLRGEEPQVQALERADREHGGSPSAPPGRGSGDRPYSTGHARTRVWRGAGCPGLTADTAAAGES
jgi:hypothetical protein